MFIPDLSNDFIFKIYILRHHNTSYPASPPLNPSPKLSAVFGCNVCAASVSGTNYNQPV